MQGLGEGIAEAHGAADYHAVKGKLAALAGEVIAAGRLFLTHQLVDVDGPVTPLHGSAQGRPHEEQMDHGPRAPDELPYRAEHLSRGGTTVEGHQDTTQHAGFLLV